MTGTYHSPSGPVKPFTPRRLTPYKVVTVRRGGVAFLMSAEGTVYEVGRPVSLPAWKVGQVVNVPEFKCLTAWRPAWSSLGFTYLRRRASAASTVARAVFNTPIPPLPPKAQEYVTACLAE